MSFWLWLVVGCFGVFVVFFFGVYIMRCLMQVRKQVFVNSHLVSSLEYTTEAVSSKLDGWA